MRPNASSRRARSSCSASPRRRKKPLRSPPWGSRKNASKLSIFPSAWRLLQVATASPNS